MTNRSEWTNCFLGDVITLKRGYDLPSHQRSEGAFPIVSSSGVSGHHNEGKVKGPGVVTGRYGTLGEVFFISEDFWPLNTSLYVQDFRGNDPRFISYFLRTLGLDRQNIAGAVPGVNRNALHMLPVRKPPVSVQRRISAVLSVYDDLIDNNRRRIKILDEMAQSLYREWFVHFRFPGHEKTKLIDSPVGVVPQGWETKRVKDVLKRLAAGQVYTEKTVATSGRVPVIDQSRDDVLGYHNNEPDHAATADSPVIAFGDHTCKMQLMVEPFSVGPNVVPFVSQNRIPILYLYFIVRNLVETREYKRHWTELTAKHVVLATNYWAERFAKIATPMFEQIDVLRRKNLNLRRTRDLLLPKLISGDVEVEVLKPLER